MHGRLKVRTSEMEKALKAKERAKKVVAYQAGMSTILKKREKKEFDEEALSLTGSMLVLNPDIATLWNFRRETILELMAKNENGEEFLKKLFDSELQLTEYCLKQNPKSYCTWHQRVWVLDTRKDPNWEAELILCTKSLKLDERNFHCWDYRTQLVSRAEVDLKNEFEFSTEKIEENFSNYSAWHYRSKLLSKLFPDEKGIRFIKEDCHRDELELVLNAAFTDPNDTSAWFYQRWLLGYSKKQLQLAVFRISSEESFVAFTDNVCMETVKIKILLNNIEVNGAWRSLYGFKSDKLWIFKHDSKFNLTETDSAACVLSIDDETTNSIECKIAKDEGVEYNVPKFENDFGDSILAELENQRSSSEQLLELEPESKWTNLALAVISHSIDHINYYKTCIALCKTLGEIDFKRVHYYEDLASRWYLEYFLECHMDLVKQGKFKMSQDDDSENVRLTALYHLQYWSACTEVDLSNQGLTTRCLPSLKVLQNCEILDLRGNAIASLRGFPALPKLKILHLSNNKLDEESEEFLSFKSSNSFSVQ